jgi:phosphate transport system permease protein
MRRNAVDHLFRLATGLCALAALGALGTLLWAIASRGWSALSWRFLADPMRMVGADGGIFYHLVGTLILIATAFLACAPVATALALLHGVYLRHHPARRMLSLLLTVLSGVPSILFGLFGMIVFGHWLGWGKSWLAGGLLLGFMILPTVTLSLAERIASVPARYLEAAAGLGLRQSQIVHAVILPQSLGGLVTGSLLGLARAAGETAPIMFTATIFAGATIPNGIKENPVLSLPYHIFVLAQDSFDPSVGGKVWGAALVLLGVVFSLSLAALPARLTLHEEARNV